MHFLHVKNLYFLYMYTKIRDMLGYKKRPTITASLVSLSLDSSQSPFESLKCKLKTFEMIWKFRQ